MEFESETASENSIGDEAQIERKNLNENENPLMKKRKKKIKEEEKRNGEKEREILKLNELVND